MRSCIEILLERFIPARFWLADAEYDPSAPLENEAEEKVLSDRFRTLGLLLGMVGSSGSSGSVSVSPATVVSFSDRGKTIGAEQTFCGTGCRGVRYVVLGRQG